MTTRFVSSRSRSGTDAQQAYDTLKEHEREQHLADESQMTAELYSDPAWNWGAWGPWGPGWGAWSLTMTAWKSVGGWRTTRST